MRIFQGKGLECSIVKMPGRNTWGGGGEENIPFILQGWQNTGWIFLEGYRAK